MFEIFIGILLIPFYTQFFYKIESDTGRYIFNNSYYAIFMFCLLFFISGFRNLVIGNDTLAYADMFRDTDIRGDFWFFEGRIELGYQYLNKFIKKYLDDNVYVLFIVSSFFIQYTHVRFMYLNSRKLWFSIFLFVTHQYYFFTVSAIRQGIAMGLCLLAYNAMLKGKIKYVLFYLFLAYTFHYSSLIFLFLFVFKKLKFEKKIVFFFSLITLVLFFFIGNIMESLTSGLAYGQFYMEDGISDDFSTRIASIILALFSFIIMLFAYINDYHKLAKNDLSVKLELWCSFINLILGVLAIKFGILIRFTYYFAIITVIMIPNIICRIESKKKRNFLFFLWFLISFIFIMVILDVRPEWYNFYPYKFNWE